MKEGKERSRGGGSRSDAQRARVVQNRDRHHDRVPVLTTWAPNSFAVPGDGQVTCRGMCYVLGCRTKTASIAVEVALPGPSVNSIDPSDADGANLERRPRSGANVCACSNANTLQFPGSATCHQFSLVPPSVLRIETRETDARRSYRPCASSAYRTQRTRVGL